MRFDAAIDDFKELFSRPEKSLDISWDGGTRRYVATCSTHAFDRDHYHINGVPWTAEFIVSSGVGKDTGDTLALDENELTTDDGDVESDFIGEDSFDLEGSKAPQPVITLEMAAATSDMLGIEYENADTGERIIITRDADWDQAGKQIIIDCANKRVTDNLSGTEQVEGKFFGTFPRFKLGTNNVRIRSGGIINQRSSESTIPGGGGIPYIINGTSDRLALSFQVPYTDNTFGGVVLALAKNGTPSNNLVAQVCPDDGGEPDLGSPVATWTFAPSDVPASPDFEYLISNPTSPFTLAANTPYWMVIYSVGVDGSNYFYVAASASITYPRGHAMFSADGGSSWTGAPEIPAFRLLMGGLSGETEIKHSVSYRKTYL